MSALRIQQTLSEIEKNMATLAPHRGPALFNEFLVKGYTAITLNSVTGEQFPNLLQAKLCLGTLITLYDDFADRPTQSNPQLLEILYQLRFGSHSSIKCLNPHDRHVLEFAQFLFAEIKNILSQLPHHGRLKEILNFDLTQFYTANQFSSLLTAHPEINNPLENRLYTHHNMGMVMVGMMDLMASERINFSELGAIREVFLMGQRLGRIFNVLATHNREVLDDDITGELATCRSSQEIDFAKQNLRNEICDLFAKIESFENRISVFSVRSYLEGLENVQNLHKKMEGII